MEIFQLLETAEKAAGEGYLRTTRRLYEEGLPRFPEHTLFLNFNLGALLQMQAGDGMGAREAYKQALGGQSKSSGFLKASGLDEIEANICENSMLLSLSFEEYEEWATRLEKLQPRNPILRHQRPEIRDMKKRGHAWYMAMLSIAKSGYDANPSKDPGRYAASASILQLLLLNRRELRVPRDEYRFAVVSYAALAVQAWSNCGIAMEKARRQENFEEINFVVEQAVPLVKEFVQSNPTDNQAQTALKTMENALAAVTQKTSAATPKKAVTRPPTIGLKPIAWDEIVVGAIGSGIVGFFLAPKIGLTRLIGALIALAAGGLVVFLNERFLARKQLRSQATAPRWQISMELTEACRNAGVQGIRFVLKYALIAPDMSLAIRFEPFDVIPSEKQQQSFLALRCVVALTFFEILKTVPSIAVAGRERQIMPLSPGVPVQTPILRRGGTTLAPIRITGEIEGDAWWVGLQPYPPDPLQFTSGLQKRVLKPLVPAFERLKGQMVILPG